MNGAPGVNEIGLCTFGDFVHDPASGDGDVDTYTALSGNGIRRLYMVVRAPDRPGFVRRIGKVIVVALGADRSVIGRIALAVGSLRVGFRLHRREQVDVFAASDPLMSGLVGLVLKAVTRKPLLVHVQSELIELDRGWTTGLRRRAMSLLTQMICRRADLVRCVSLSIERSVIASGVPRTRVVYLPPRVDLERFSPSRRLELREAVRTELGLNEARVLLFAGSLTRRKGVDRLVRILPRISVHHPSTVLLIVGSGPLQHLVESTAGHLGVANRVFLVGSIPHDEMTRMLAAADMMVLPSLNEGLPRVILEAMASGVPVIVTDVGGVSEVVQDRRTGRLVPAADDRALLQAVLDVLDAPADAQRWAIAGRGEVEKGYERDANLREYAQLVRSLAPGGHTEEHDRR